MALINGGQIRGSLDAGPVTLGEVLSVLPFDSSLVTLQVTGEVLRQALENSVSQWPDHDGRFLQVSGLRVTFDMTAPVGFRVKEVLVGDGPLDLSRTYTIGTDSFLAEGGDGYSMFSQGANRIDFQTPLRDLLLKALAEAPLQAVTKQRLVFENPSSSP